MSKNTHVCSSALRRPSREHNKASARGCLATSRKSTSFINSQRHEVTLHPEADSLWETAWHRRARGLPQTGSDPHLCHLRFFLSFLICKAGVTTVSTWGVLVGIRNDDCKAPRTVPGRTLPGRSKPSLDSNSGISGIPGLCCSLPFRPPLSPEGTQHGRQRLSSLPPAELRLLKAIPGARTGQQPRGQGSGGCLSEQAPRKKSKPGLQVAGAASACLVLSPAGRAHRSNRKVPGAQTRSFERSSPL